jgi:hypothetical protein
VRQIATWLAPPDLIVRKQRRDGNSRSVLLRGLVARAVFDDTTPGARLPEPLMTAITQFSCIFGLFAALALAGCTTAPTGEMPTASQAAPAAAAAAPAAQQADQPPMDTTEARAQCWMKYDKSGASLEAKAQMVGKCVADKMKGQ